MVKARTYLRTRKAKKSEVLDDFCKEEGYCRRHAAVSCTRQDSGTSWESAS